MRRDSGASLFDRLVSVATYLTFGMVGLAWLIISFFVKKIPTQFVSYHIYQSIFFSLLLYILSLFFSISLDLIGSIPFLAAPIKWVVLFFNAPLYFGFSLIHFTTLVFVIYLSLGALLGMYSYIPFISDIVGSNFRR